ncbi:MAG: radical SAM protein [Candidatus Latescibacteria bacterium]|nr:radical SAM protein [Candidatus Latescibacterota bacterium]
MGYLFGPVPSRRLGLSLGVDIVPLKTCSLSCVYCQIGKTPETTILRREYVPAAEILSEIKTRLENGLQTDWITFSGSGEPTLNSGIGDMIKGIRELTDIPVCVITNGTLLWDPQVRSDILDADAVMPSLDSAVESTFRAICRPHHDLNLEYIIDGLIRFRREYKRKIWLEIMLLEGINDNEKELAALKSAVEKISPDSIQLNTVVRPPAELLAKPLSHERLLEIRDFFGNKAEIIASFKKNSIITKSSDEDGIREYLKRRPGTTEDISVSLGIPESETESLLRKIHDSGEIRQTNIFGKQFWEYNI